MVMEYSPIFVTEDNHKDLLGEVSSKPMSFTRSRVWVMPLKYASKLPLRLDSNIMFYEKTSPSGFTVYEAYAIKGGTPITSELYEWTGEEIIRDEQIPSPVNLLEKRSDLGGIVMNIAWLNWVRRETGIFGRVADIMSDIQSQLNFTFNTIPPTQNAYGFKMENGTWNGLVGMLVDKKIDMTSGKATHSFMMTQERTSVVDYLWPDDLVKITLLASKSSKPRIDVLGYMHVFPVAVWLTSFSFIVIATLFYSLTHIVF